MSHLYESKLTQIYAENMEILRVKNRLTQAEFAKSIGLTLATYKRIISGITTKIDINVAHAMYEKYGMTIPEMLGQVTPNVALMKKVSKLTKRQKAYINALIDFELDLGAKSNAEDYISVYIPTGNMHDGMIYDSSAIEHVNIADYKRILGEKVTYGVKITSNHLHPTYNEGDILLVCEEPPRDGDTGLFLNKDNKSIYIRKFRQGKPCLLESINGIGRPITVDPYDKADMDKWAKLGYVITKIR